MNRRKMDEQIKLLTKLKEGNDKSQLIGQFGVGFYSSYMVSDNVDVLSRDAENDEINLWKSNGKENYSIEKAKKITADTVQNLSSRDVRSLLVLLDKIEISK